MTFKITPPAEQRRRAINFNAGLAQEAALYAVAQSSTPRAVPRAEISVNRVPRAELMGSKIWSFYLVEKFFAPREPRDLPPTQCEKKYLSVCNYRKATRAHIHTLRSSRSDLLTFILERDSSCRSRWSLRKIPRAVAWQFV